MRRFLVVLMTMGSAACFNYTPITKPVPNAGTDIRIDLTDAGSVQLAPTIGQRIEALDGKLVEQSPAALVLHVTGAIDRGGLTIHWNGERVDVPRSAIESVQTRQLSVARSSLAGALGVAGAFLVGAAFGVTSGIPGLHGVFGGGGRK